MFVVFLLRAFQLCPRHRLIFLRLDILNRVCGSLFLWATYTQTLKNLRENLTRSSICMNINYGYISRIVHGQLCYALLHGLPSSTVQLVKLARLLKMTLLGVFASLCRSHEPHLASHSGPSRASRSTAEPQFCPSVHCCARGFVSNRYSDKNGTFPDKMALCQHLCIHRHCIRNKN